MTRKQYFAAALIAGLITISSCATFSYRTQEAVIPEEAYSVMEDGSVRVDLSLVPSLEGVGGAATIEDHGLTRNLIIVRPDENDYVAASSHCTHRGKALAYDHEARAFRCSAMGKSEFGLDGRVLKGPAKRPLRIYAITFEGDSLVIRDAVE
jgi:Rieske Fe-S protein